MWQYLVGAFLGAFGTLIFGALKNRNRMIQYGKQKRMEEEKRRLEEERERERIQEQNRIENQRLLAEQRLRKQQRLLAQQRKEESDREKLEELRIQREKEELERQERKRLELEAKKICREIKRSNSPVCPNKKTCDKKDCKATCEILCSNCNVHLCSKCHEKSVLSINSKKSTIPENSTTPENSSTPENSTTPDTSIASNSSSDDSISNSDCSSCYLKNSMKNSMQKIEHTDTICMQADHDYDCFIKTCKHIYHKECLMDYQKVNSKCIICYKKFTEEDISSDFFDPNKAVIEYNI
uniref:RING-type domain-containing protein n=1 Tax=Cacopsylla melanoneura TaxID=428564 RepID=A0A8D8VFM8_9HEMI